MSGEIVVSETPNWLQELEAKRERRLKAKLGHEAGAGAPCLKCGEKCPGLDLHFWRKCCKICKCSKEEHEVQDDDIYGWAQFQLVGSNPNKIKRKILLPGKNDEIDLEWVPKGHNETIDKYLKTLPPEQLPVKGSQAAQDRKQLLQKQIPIHDIDPSLCHELTEDELKKMNEYIAHVKQSSAGVGQIVSLSSIIKGKLHILNPAEAALIASRYGKGIPMSEIVKLQAISKANALGQSMEKMSIKNKNLPHLVPNVINQSEDVTNPSVSTRMHDKEYSLYSTDINKTDPNAQFSASLTPKQFRNTPISHNQISSEPTIDQKYLQNPNFNPKNRPSNFVNPNTRYNPIHHVSSGKIPFDFNSENSAFVPYQNISSVPKSGDCYMENNFSADPKFAEKLQDQIRNSSFDPNYSRIEGDEQIYENVKEMKKPSSDLPNYIPGKYNTFAEIQNPTKIPKNVKDLAFSTYEPGQMGLGSQDENGFQLGKYRQPGSFVEDDTTIPKNSNGFKPIEAGNYSNTPKTHQFGQANQQFEPTNSKGSSAGPKSANSIIHNTQFEPLRTNAFNSNSYPLNSTSLTSEDLGNSGFPLGSAYQKHGSEFLQHPIGVISGDLSRQEAYNNQKSGGTQFEPSLGEMTEDLGGHGIYNNPNTAGNTDSFPRQYIQKNPNTGIAKDPLSQQYLQNQADTGELGNNYPSLYKHVGDVMKPNQQLSELHPNDLKINEDFVNPSQVNIGLIQDINYPDIKTATHETGDFYEEYSPDSIKEILNNVILPDCHYCKKSFEENEFAVTIDRANVLFHSGCFKCAGCNQLLADNVYFYNKETDNIYCLRDYAKIRGFPRCKACDELIFTKEYCLAENSTFHLKHFCCTECDMPLAGQDYTLEGEMPYCLPCFEQNKASKCNTCAKVIKPDEVGCNLKGIHFHAVDACFACKMCKTPLMGKKLLLRNDKLYCSHDCFGGDQ